mmetsp:Transcript_1388/g.1769  ORF Transcript_1388/g.1769 Transcript_1388/m.1769 type:complete len:113 (-) Transcript_1388:497-835(-)
MYSKKTRDPHIITKYYYGAAPSPEEQDEIFKGQPSGSFITYFRHVDGIPWYFAALLDDGKRLEIRISGPDALPSELTWLNNPIFDPNKRSVKHIPNVGASNLLDQYESLFDL